MLSIRERIRKIIAKHSNLKSLVTLILIVFSIVGLWVYRSELVAFIALLRNREELISQIEQYGPAGAVFLATVLMLQVLVAALPGHALIVVGGYFYGFLFGFLITHTTIVLSSQFCYFLARKYGRPIVERLAPKKTVDKWTRRAERQGVIFFIIAFNVPIFPADVMNYVAGLIGLSPKKFFFANLLGKLPCSILFTLIGSHGYGISPQFLVAAVVLTIISLGIWQVISARLEQKYAGEQS